MKKLLTPSLILNAVLLLIVTGYMIFTRPAEKPFPAIISVVKVKVVPIPVNVLVEKPIPVTEYDSIPYPIYIDSSETVKDYFVFRKYDITLRDDSIAKLCLKAEVWKNNLQRAELTGQIYTKEKIIENTTVKTITEPKRIKGFVGIAPGFDAKSFNVMVSGMVALQDKKEHIYSLKYEPFRKQGEIGILWKIRLKK